MGSPIFQLFKKYGLFEGADVRVTHSNASESRSESAVAVNPTNSNNLICASKKFIDPQKYHFTVRPLYSLNAGWSWNEVTPPHPDSWDGMTDPVVAFSPSGRAHLVVEPLRFDSDDITVTGLFIFNSDNGGQSWSDPINLISEREVDGNDDKSWLACDASGGPYHGNVYSAWGVGTLCFSRSSDGGQTWRGAGSLPAGAKLTSHNAWAPEISVGPDGVIHIVWHVLNSTTIRYTRSTDGGETFSPAVDAVTGITDLHAGLWPNGAPANAGSWPEFPHSKFRVMTLSTGCTIANGNFLVAWSDMREGLARIYYRIAQKAGPSTWNWLGPASGSPLLPWFPAGNGLQHFHPQLIATKSDVVGCAFYEFGPKLGKYLIDTRIAGSFSEGTSFEYLANVTDSPWDPAVNAPLSHGNPNDTFIGEYFGLDAADEAFAVLWTDTRTGVQELFFDAVATSKTDMPEKFKGISAEILIGVSGDGGGFIIVGGKIIKVPPRGPKEALLHALVALDAAEQMTHAAGRPLAQAAARAIGAIAKDVAEQHEGILALPQARTVF
jgi:hypothetical protein